MQQRNIVIRRAETIWRVLAWSFSAFLFFTVSLFGNWTTQGIVAGSIYMIIGCFLGRTERRRIQTSLLYLLLIAPFSCIYIGGFIANKNLFPFPIFVVVLISTWLGIQVAKIRRYFLCWLIAGLILLALVNFFLMPYWPGLLI